MDVVSHSHDRAVRLQTNGMLISRRNLCDAGPAPDIEWAESIQTDSQDCAV